jgi:hypothetical protein
MNDLDNETNAKTNNTSSTLSYPCCRQVQMAFDVSAEACIMEIKRDKTNKQVALYI